MIFRKPYAFLIKNFRKIHIVMLLLCAFVFYKTMQLNGFIDEFLIYLSYNPELEPITQYTSLIFYLSILGVVFTTLVLMVLLRRKGKPWKLYIVLLFAYFLVFCVFAYTVAYCVLVVLLLVELFVDANEFP